MKKKYEISKKTKLPLKPINHVVNDEVASSSSMKRKASETEQHDGRKKPRIFSDDKDICKEMSRVVSDDDVTMVERRTSSGRKLKIVCYRKLNDGVADNDEDRTTLSHVPKSTKSPLVSPNAKSESLPVISSSPNVKTSSVKHIGKIRALRDNEIDVLFSDESENENESDDEDDKCIDHEPKHTQASRKITSVSILKGSSDTQNTSPKPVSKQSSKNHPEDSLKAMPLHDIVTPKKSRRDSIKSKSTIKKRFQCKECSMAFSCRAELREHDEEEHDDFQPISKTPSR